MSFNTNEVHRSYRLDESRRMRRYAGWLPAHPAIHREFLRKHHEHGRTRMRSRSKHCSAVAHFKAAILADRVMVELFEQVFLQAARVPGIPAVSKQTWLR